MFVNKEAIETGIKDLQYIKLHNKSMDSISLRKLNNTIALLKEIDDNRIFT